MVESQPTREIGHVFVGRQREMAELRAALDLRHPRGSLGTVGLLEVQGATASVSLLELTGER